MEPVLEAWTIDRVDLTERQTSLSRIRCIFGHAGAYRCTARWIGALADDTLRRWSADGEEYRRICHRRISLVAFDRGIPVICCKHLRRPDEAWPAPMTPPKSSSQADSVHSF